MPATSPSPFVLVHGAWHDSSAWKRVVPLLEASGHRVFTPDLTGHGAKSALLGPEVGLETHVGDVLDVILAEDLTDVVLVGHSYAGMVVSTVANEVPERIANLVYLDAMVPDDGETAADVLPVTSLMIEAASASDEPWRIPPLPESPAPAGLFGVTDPEDLAWLRTTLGDESVLCYQQPARLDNPALEGVARSYIQCVDNVPAGIVRRPVPAQPNGDPAVVHELRSGHDCMITVPNELVGILLSLT
ncbi:esterase [Frondihabitans sucicola]|uniref:Esterase n=1 Tax=Frondihabitans sucicola TaxID=1268041 RepID=A0ABN6XWJ1_9MICO|nr:alpha/beta hydrolase [Frondihabitans sucicola]BDZ49379.1 esterase [Frondihabitans sucicola]